MITIDPITPTIGAQISGIDLNDDLTTETLDEIYQALLDHLVIFFRDQDLTSAAHIRFAESFGPVQGSHPIYSSVDGFEAITKIENSPNNPPDNAEWHTDMTFKATAPFAAVLHGKVLPPSGGDTLWSSLYASYEGLSTQLQQELLTYTAVHDMGSFRNTFAGRDGGMTDLNDAMKNVGSAEHPIVRHHPVTNKPLLFVNQTFTRLIVGMTQQDSDRMLQFLFDHMNRPDFQVRFRWQTNSLAVWDNRVTQHYAVADYMPHDRLMHRVLVREDRRA